MKKEHILNEIRRTADKETNQALGQARLEKETGIQKKDWYGIHWATYGEAVKEAKCNPNKYNKAFDEEWVVEQLIYLIDKKNKFPTSGELRLERRNNKDFPSHSVFETKPKMVKKVVEYCEKNNMFPNVLEICRPICKPDETNNLNEIDDDTDENDWGFVYLIKHDKDYKIGRTKDVGKRKYDLGLILPKDIEEIHEIRTDDPAGIEKYWHNKFKDKRGKGEWFNLTSQDIKTFKKRKFM
ncbi:MAG: GIY-YIG nuclease family protein [Bacteroidetes bacterium]|nr:GIY-YIG nuclease family protein [Bacteroidota bacterium]